MLNVHSVGLLPASNNPEEQNAENPDSITSSDFGNFQCTEINSTGIQDTGGHDKAD